MVRLQAQPLPKGKVFVPAKSDRFLTIPEGFQLPGDQRSVQRAEFDSAMAAKERRQQVWAHRSSCPCSCPTP